jgi:hypothetical protein
MLLQYSTYFCTSQENCQDTKISDVCVIDTVGVDCLEVEDDKFDLWLVFKLLEHEARAFSIYLTMWQ